MKILFENIVFVEAQGEHVFDLLDYGPNQAHYKVIGFNTPSLFITDFRKNVNKYLEKCIANNDYSRFAYTFSQPAKLCIKVDSKNDYWIELNDSDVTIPAYILWIVVGMSGEIPIYSCEIQEIQSNQENTSSGMLLYKLEPEKMIPFIELSKSASLFC
jgi:hypothetical protein